MEYYMSVDGGGTKIIALLFNDQLQLLGCGRGLAINHFFDAHERIVCNMTACIEQCLSGHKGIHVEKLYMSLAGPAKLFVEILESMASVGEAVAVTEGMMGLLAGVQKTKGAVALSGTGSGAFWIDGLEKARVGGWGSLLGDQGSGFDIGKKGLEAAVRAYENWGPKTSIHEIVMDEWNLGSLYEVIPMIYQVPSYRPVIASVAPLVAKAACMGDDVAAGIIWKAGRDMALQIIALLKRVGPAGDIPITVCGGAWKGCHLMYDSFCRHVLPSCPKADIRVPLFDPVVGGVVRIAMDSRGGMDDELLNRLMIEFAPFRHVMERPESQALPGMAGMWDLHERMHAD